MMLSRGRRQHPQHQVLFVHSKGKKHVARNYETLTLLLEESCIGQTMDKKCEETTGVDAPDLELSLVIMGNHLGTQDDKVKGLEMLHSTSSFLDILAMSNLRIGCHEGT